MFPGCRGNRSGSVSLVGGNACRESHAFLNARAELRRCPDDEVTKGFPNLLRLNNSKRFPPVIEAAGCYRSFACRGQLSPRPLQETPPKRRYFVIGLGEGVGRDNKVVYRREDRLSSQQDFADAMKNAWGIGKPARDIE